MTCKNCKIKPVITLPNTNIKLCKSCFIKYFEKKVAKTIRQFKLIENNDNIIVGVSGGKDSITTLYLLNKLPRKHQNIKVTALLIDEGIKGYRNKTIEDAKKFCKEFKIKLKIVSYKKEMKYSLDEIKTKLKINNLCSICGVFRRYLLNKYAKKLKATKLATGHNLDDEAQSVIMNQFKNNIEISARLGPITGIIKDPNFIPRIKPLYLLTEREVASYAFLKGFIGKFTECPNAKFSFRNDVRDMLNNFEEKYPGTKHSIISGFIELLPLLKEKYKKNASDLKACSICGEPSSKEICKACQEMNKIKKL